MMPNEICGTVFVGTWTGSQMTVHKYGFTSWAFQPAPAFMSLVSTTETVYATKELAVMMTGLEEPDSTFVEKLSRRETCYTDGPIQMFVEKSLKEMADEIAKKGKILRKGRLFNDV